VTIIGMLLAYSWQAAVTESNLYSEIALVIRPILNMSNYLSELSVMVPCKWQFFIRGNQLL
jgi:hypothetical protein